jgi:hypothetical protein
MTHHFLFLIGVIRVDQWSDFGVCLRFSISAIFGNHGNFGNLVDTHPAFFQLLLKTKAEPSIDPWVALASRLGWPLHGPWVAQGWPNPKPQSPIRQRVTIDFTFWLNAEW